MNRLAAHVRALWPRHPLLPIAPFFVVFAIRAAQGQIRWDRVVGMLILPPLLAYLGPRTRRVYLAFLPVGCVGLLYDFMAELKNVGLTPARVHVCDLRLVESRLFGFRMGGVPMTLHDWFLVHHHPVLDAICAFPYGFFIFAILGYAAWLALRDIGLAQRYGWAFFLLNVAGFVTYHLYPAAPPWYFHAHGCAVDLATRGAPGAALARVDALIGFDYFGGMYGRSNDTFGAVPSLHVAYPLLMCLVGWRLHGPAVRAALAAFFGLMCFSAVYLDHHWVIDVVLGILYCVAIHSLVWRALAPRFPGERDDDGGAPVTGQVTS